MGCHESLGYSGVSKAESGHASPFDSGAYFERVAVPRRIASAQFILQHRAVQRREAVLGSVLVQASVC